jgi:hypothetical protein
VNFWYCKSLLILIDCFILMFIAICVVKGYGLHNSGFKSRLGKGLSPFHTDLTGSGDHPASYSRTTAYYLSEVKRPGRETGSVHASSFEVKIEGI